jgi:hypothetical protein
MKRPTTNTIDQSSPNPEVSRRNLLRAAALGATSADLNGLNDYRLVLAEILEKRCSAGSVSTIFPGISSDRSGVVRPR